MAYTSREPWGVVHSTSRLLILSDSLVTVQSHLRRVKYTLEDEKLMCQYVAKRAPNPESGGRSGLGFWKCFVNQANVSLSNIIALQRFTPVGKELGYEGAQRHTAQSWREHYKKNRQKLDAMVSDIVPQLPASTNGETSYRLSRLVTKRAAAPIIEQEVGHKEDVMANEVEDPITHHVTRRRRDFRSNSHSLEAGNFLRPPSRLEEEEEEPSDDGGCSPGTVDLNTVDQNSAIIEDLDESVLPEQTFELSFQPILEFLVTYYFTGES